MFESKQIKWTKEKPQRFLLFAYKITDRFGGLYDLEHTADNMNSIGHAIRQCITKYPEKQQIFQILDFQEQRIATCHYCNGKLDYDFEVDFRIFNSEVY